MTLATKFAWSTMQSTTPAPICRAFLRSPTILKLALCMFFRLEIGECFVNMDSDDVESYVEEKKKVSSTTL